ncbi:MAG: phytanoyl-CoA dioxygenase [Deltaproteobacteria bacterium]|nr:phytanoyl-CoA dioxygenase [Deltaproteobacteria bacterium]
MNDRLPDLSDAFALRAAAIEDYRRDGHVVVPGLATAEEVARFRPGLLRASEAAPQREKKPLEERDTYGKAFLQMFNLWRQNEVARAFVHARRFARVAAELMGVTAVRLYHDQALFKEPAGGATPWHQDQFYWPLQTADTVTLWMPLVPTTREMGLMTFASGSQSLGNLGDFAISDASHREFERLIAEKGLQVAAEAALAPGDASFHAGWTLHSASSNQTDAMREVMTIIYYADGTLVGPLDHPNRRFDRDVWLRGCEPGEPAAGPLNPVLYERGEAESRPGFPAATAWGATRGPPSPASPPGARRCARARRRPSETP